MMFKPPLLLLLCALIQGQSSMQPLNATVKGSVLLPCSTAGSPGSLSWFYWQEVQTLNILFHWDKSGKTRAVADRYKGRCHAFNTEFSSGNISIRFDNVSVGEDQKMFLALVGFYDEQRKVPTSVKLCQSQLQVSAPYRDLELTVNHTASSAGCTARGGYPAPRVWWTGVNKSDAAQLEQLDAQTSLQRDPTDQTFSVTSRVSVKDLQSVTCFIHNAHCNQRLSQTRPIDDENKSGPGLALLSLLIVPVVIAIIIIVFLYIRRRRSQIPRNDGRNSPAQETMMQ